MKHRGEIKRMPFAGVAGVTRSTTATDALRLQRRALALQEEAGRRRWTLTGNPATGWNLARSGFRSRSFRTLDQVSAAVYGLFDP
jgi:hypothetical protein